MSSEHEVVYKLNLSFRDECARDPPGEPPIWVGMCKIHSECGKECSRLKEAHPHAKTMAEK